MEERKLATIEVIKDLQPIEGADLIEVATIRGWQVVVKKGEFNIGDLCIYCEIDSVLPQRPEFYFLQASHFRIKTIRLRGQISQGICFPITILAGNKKLLDDVNPIPENEIIYPTVEFVPSDDGHILTMFYDKTCNNYREFTIGDDVTDIIGITKYEPPIPAQLAGKVKGNFPSFIPKTDEERIQNMEWVLTEYKDELFYVTEKLDGTSFTAYYNNGVFGVCSRNLDLFETEDNTHWKVARELKLEERMKIYGENIALQGELIGEGINENRLKIKGHSIRFFSIFDIDKYRYYNYNMFNERIFQFGLETVPIVSHITGFKLFSTINEMIEYSKGKSVLNTNQEREGIVIRPCENIEHPKYGRISFKVLNNKYLLKNE